MSLGILAPPDSVHYADLHHPDSIPGGVSTRPGTERGVTLAGAGTPLVRESRSPRWQASTSPPMPTPTPTVDSPLERRLRALIAAA